MNNTGDILFRDASQREGEGEASWGAWWEWRRGGKGWREDQRGWQGYLFGIEIYRNPV